MAYHTIIIGGGISGLCTAFYLKRRLGADAVCVLEAAEQPGGTARTDVVHGAVCEWGPNGFLDREPLTLAWARDLGLEGEMIRANEAAAHRFLVKDGRLVELVGPPRFLVSPLLSVRGRARLLWEPLVAARRDHRNESIWDFAARRIGKEAADTLVSSMVLGIHGGDAKQLSLEHCFPRMAEMEREHRSLFRAMKTKARERRKSGGEGGAPMGPGGTLTSFRGGMGAMTVRAGEAMENGLRLDTRVTKVAKDGTTFAVTTEAGEVLHAEHVVLASPAYATAEQIQAFAPDAARACAAIPYAPIVVLCAAYRRQDVRHYLNGFGFLVPRNEGRRVLGCIWSSSVFPEHVPEGWVLLRAMFGGAVDPEAIQMTDREMVNQFMQEVAPLLSIDREPEWTQRYRYDRGIPQYVLRHGERLAAIEAAEKEHPGLVFANNAYWGVGVNDCVVMAHRGVEKLVGQGAT